MSTIYLIHGFNVKDGGKATTGSLRGGLERAGHKVKELKYGWMGRIRVRLCNKSIARMLKDVLEPDDVVIAHSNGCAIAYQAMTFGAKCRHVVLINPALDADKEIPNVRNVTVFYSPTDKWTRLAKWIPWSPWGNQGQVGFTGTNTYDMEGNRPKYKQYNEDLLTGTKCDHSGIFNFRRKLLTIITGVIL